jgi:hypothetical protein
MELLSNEVLVHCYRDAVRLGLEQAFIDLLAMELKRRDLDSSTSYIGSNCKMGA